MRIWPPKAVKAERGRTAAECDIAGRCVFCTTCSRTLHTHPLHSQNSCNFLICDQITSQFLVGAFKCCFFSSFEQKQNVDLFLQLLPWQHCSTQMLHRLCDLSSAIKVVLIMISDQKWFGFSKGTFEQLHGTDLDSKIWAGRICIWLFGTQQKFSLLFTLYSCYFIVEEVSGANQNPVFEVQFVFRVWYIFWWRPEKRNSRSSQTLPRSAMLLIPLNILDLQHSGVYYGVFLMLCVHTWRLARERTCAHAKYTAGRE